jgi:hypothetical protein
VLPDRPLPGWPSAEGRAVARGLRRLGMRIGRRRVARAGAWSAAAAVAVAVGCRMIGVGLFPSLALVMATALVPVLFVTWRHMRTATPVMVAREIEQQDRGFDNLLVTAAELGMDAQPRTALAGDVSRAALVRLAAFDEQSVGDGRRVLVLFAILLGIATILTLAPRDTSSRHAPAPEGVTAAAEMLAIDGLGVVVTPPEYLGRAPAALEEPQRLEVPHGSHVAIIVSSLAARVEVLEPDAPARELTGDPPSVTLRAEFSTVWTIRALAADGGVVDERLLPVAIVEDRPPTVRVVEPGGDQTFPDARRRVAVALEAVDDHGLGRLVLRYTRVTGSGETFTFTEGEMPVRIERRSPREWRGAAELDLEALGLEVGDTLVYRAAARDRRPGAADAVSDSLLIEIGGVAGAATGGFTLPEDEHRHAISQQMVIIKTEALHAARAKMTPEAFLEESHHLSAEQRMVRAEFVFMTGGHVHDEVEEAEASHELAEGRFENEAMVEMLAASAHMSRAERHLVDGDTAQALVAERLALTALQRAFDRRRYFLRTTPERSRIDLDRRLSGSLDDARAWVRDRAPSERDAKELAEVEQVLRLVDRAAASPEVALTDVARAVAAIDPARRTCSGPWRCWAVPVTRARVSRRWRTPGRCCGRGPRGGSRRPPRRRAGRTRHAAGCVRRSSREAPGDTGARPARSGVGDCAGRARRSGADARADRPDRVAGRDGSHSLARPARGAERRHARARSGGCDRIARGAARIAVPRAARRGRWRRARGLVCRR